MCVCACSCVCVRGCRAGRVVGCFCLVLESMPSAADLSAVPVTGLGGQQRESSAQPRRLP